MRTHAGGQPSGTRAYRGGKEKQNKAYQPKILPRRDVVLERDRPAGPLTLPDGEVLVEGLRALDGRRVGADDFVDVVGCAVGAHGAFVGACRPGVVGSLMCWGSVQNAFRCGGRSEKGHHIHMCQ